MIYDFRSPLSKRPTFSLKNKANMRPHRPRPSDQKTRSPGLVKIPLVPGAKTPAKLFEFFLVGLSFQMQVPGQGEVQMIVLGYVIHVPSLGEQIIDFAKIGNSDNFRYS